MGAASYLIPNFLGGEISKFAQGRVDKPDYRVSMNVSLNGFPTEIGTWTRRPGTQFAGTTRGGEAGRVIKFDFAQATPITTEWTDGYVRFRSGSEIVTTNDDQVVVDISTATPAVVETAGLHAWVTGNTVVPRAPAASALLENRQFVITVVDPTHFSIADAITGAAIDGSTLGTIAAGTLIGRVHELETVYTGDAWSSIRSVQAETTAVLLNGGKPTQALTVETLPENDQHAVFEIDSATFLDGPYLDPVEGSLISPSATVGIVTMTLAVQLYSSSLAYKKGDLASSSGVSYRSLQDANVNNTPASSPLFWEIVTPGVAVGPDGFLPTDVGRLVRIYNPSLPTAWSAVIGYSAGDIVSQSSVAYRSTVGNNLNNTPSATSSFWTTYTPGWTWGRVTGLATTGLISGTLSGTVHIGSMIQFGGLAAAFDGVVTKTHLQSAANAYVLPPDGLNYVISEHIGQNYSGASAQAITSAILYAPTNTGFLAVSGQAYVYPSLFNLRASNTAPASPSDGTLLASKYFDAVNLGGAITMTSVDPVTTWDYVWIEVITNVTTQIPSTGVTTTVIEAFAQVQFYGTSGIIGTAVDVEILGPPLPNTNQSIWRLGAYSDTTGWPTCGCYHEGRIWLGGAVANRFDASVSNGIDGNSLNFSPTATSGQVLDSSAISATLNSDGVNPIRWMDPNLQGISIGTQAGEWLVQAPTNGPLTPTNIAARRVTKIGCADVQPQRTENTTVFVQRYGRKLMEYFADVYSGKFSAPNLADKAQHITRAGIAELAYQQGTTPIIWGRDEEGALFGSTYKRDSLTTSQGPTFAAWHRHSLGSGRLIESICVGPSVGGELDTLTMVTNDPATNIRHVEVLTDESDELSPLADARHLDSSVEPTSTTTTDTASDGAPYGGLTINGLWHLNGKTVQVFAGGLDCGTGELGAISDFVVANGSVFVPYGDSISAGPGSGLFTADFAAGEITITVGFTYTSDGQIVRPALAQDTGARQGPGFGKTRRTHRYAMLLNSTKGLEVGANFANLFPAEMKQADGEADAAVLEAFSGTSQGTLADDYSYDGMVCWRITRPYPASVVAVSGNLSTQDQ